MPYHAIPGMGSTNSLLSQQLPNCYGRVDERLNTLLHHDPPLVRLD